MPSSLTRRAAARSAARPPRRSSTSPRSARPNASDASGLLEAHRRGPAQPGPPARTRSGPSASSPPLGAGPPDQPVGRCWCAGIRRRCGIGAMPDPPPPAIAPGSLCGNRLAETSVASALCRCLRRPVQPTAASTVTRRPPDCLLGPLRPLRPFGRRHRAPPSAGCHTISPASFWIHSPSAHSSPRSPPPPRPAGSRS